MGDLWWRASVPRIAACICLAALRRMMFRTRSHGRSDASTRSVIRLPFEGQLFSLYSVDHTCPKSSGCDRAACVKRPRSRSQWRKEQSPLPLLRTRIQPTAPPAPRASFSASGSRRSPSILRNHPQKLRHDVLSLRPCRIPAAWLLDPSVIAAHPATSFRHSLS